MRKVILNEMQAVFRGVFDDSELQITDETTASHIPGWDSLTHMMLIAAIERHFSIVFTFDEVRAFANVGDMINLVSEKKAG